ncbi:MAG: 16S rRNA (cytosine(1402)-N(4))-methyltransferase RsmH [Phycisphaeraceae bacterium]|nr:MAG: 16S rRNA (cytosine(1402)-N(4))-methyltransferase RsmH [Phycisphaeraceae bacterium]
MRAAPGRGGVLRISSIVRDPHSEQPVNTGDPASRLHHTPVLMAQVLRLLDPRPGDTVVDCTAGRGGHAAALAARITGEAAHAVGTTSSAAAPPAGRLLLVDLDADNLAFAAQRVRREVPDVTVETLHASFAGAPEHVKRLGWRADVVLADLGFASTQMDDPARGFSFRADGPLDMRFDRTRGISAAEWLARAGEAEIADVIYHLGEDPYARRIARKLAQSRLRESIDTTTALARLVREAYGPRARTSRVDPATRTFMALRILVNDELASLQSLLRSIEESAAVGGDSWLATGARVGVISFHSLEDRLVKQSFSGLVKRSLAEAVTRKPVTAEESEVRANPRARSAKLRVIRVTHGLASR